MFTPYVHFAQDTNTGGLFGLLFEHGGDFGGFPASRLQGLSELRCGRINTSIEVSR